MFWAYLVLVVALLVMYLPCSEVTKKFSRDFEGPFGLRHRRAIDKCLKITAASWDSQMKTRVKFVYKPFFNASHVANTEYVRKLTHFSNAYYTSSMLKSITRQDGPEEYDMIVTFDSKQNWYTGLDGKPGKEEMDMVTVCLHEMQHGLLGKVELIFFHTDKMTRWEQMLGFRTKEGRFCALKSLKTANKSRVYEAVSAGNVYFFKNNRPIAKMFAPNPYYKDVSLDHFDRSRYEDTDESVLLDVRKAGKATHFIGPVLRAMQDAIRDWQDEGPEVCDDNVSILGID